MEQGVLRKHISAPYFLSLVQYEAPWNGLAQNILGLGQSPADWRSAFSFVHVQMGSRSLVKLRVWRHPTNRRPRYLSVPHTSGTSRGGCCDGVG